MNNIPTVNKFILQLEKLTDYVKTFTRSFNPAEKPSGVYTGNARIVPDIIKIESIAPETYLDLSLVIRDGEICIKQVKLDEQMTYSFSKKNYAEIWNEYFCCQDKATLYNFYCDTTESALLPEWAFKKAHLTLNIGLNQLLDFVCNNQLINL